eukprot:gene6573-7076_t
MLKGPALPPSSRAVAVQIPESYEMELRGAEEAIESGIYVSWLPHPSAMIPASASDEIKNGQSQCCRVGSLSLCSCGHPLSNHDAILRPKRRGYIKPPKCNACTKCKSFAYMPCYPVEVGQIWLKGRRDFNLLEWRRRVRQHPEEYACVGCNLKVTDHETLIEVEADRIARNAAVGPAYIPLQEVIPSSVAIMRK